MKLYWPKEVQLTASEVLAKAHLITGPNGQCMCGVYDGQAFTCGKIIAGAFEKTESGLDE